MKMNVRCTICDAVLREEPRDGHCPDCGARSVFLEKTEATPRHAKDDTGTEEKHAWDFDPDGPILR